MITLARQATDDFEVLSFVRGPYGWVEQVTEVCERVHPQVDKQIRAIAIALDAEVIETECVRAPEKLNKAREKRGEPPLRDYHIVSLAQRHRAAPLPDHERRHRSPRLHFRRGHWRHYEEHRTWVRWTLVGNPDLGFIEKEYRL